MRGVFIFPVLLFTFYCVAQHKCQFDLFGQQKISSPKLLNGSSSEKTDSAESSPKFQKMNPFAIYNLGVGMMYGHSVGGGIRIRNRHELGAEIVAFVPQMPFKEHWFLGEYLNYRIFPFRSKNSVNCFFSGEFANNHYGFSDVDVTQKNRMVKVSYNDIYFLVGSGADIRICRNLLFQTSVQLYLAEYDFQRYSFGGGNSTTSQRFYINKFDGYTLAYLKYSVRDITGDMLLFKAGLKYSFGKRV